MNDQERRDWQAVNLAEARDERSVQAHVRLAASEAGGFMWRNNSGALFDRQGALVRFGLGNDSTRVNKVMKSSDLIGLIPHLVTLADVGKTLGIFVAAEMKRPGWHLTPGDARGHAQLNYINAVKRCGGLAAFVTDVEQYKELIQ